MIFRIKVTWSQEHGPPNPGGLLTTKILTKASHHFWAPAAPETINELSFLDLSVSLDPPFTSLALIFLIHEHWIRALWVWISIHWNLANGEDNAMYCTVITTHMNSQRNQSSRNQCSEVFKAALVNGKFSISEYLVYFVSAENWINSTIIEVKHWFRPQRFFRFN